MPSTRRMEKEESDSIRLIDLLQIPTSLPFSFFRDVNVVRARVLFELIDLRTTVSGDYLCDRSMSLYADRHYLYAFLE